MSSNSMLTLFSTYSSEGERSTPLILSVLIHGFTFVAISLVLLRAPRIVTARQEDWYRARYLDVDRLEQQLRRLSPGDSRWQREPGEESRDAAVAEQLSAYLHPGERITNGKLSSLTLLQPDLPKQVDAAMELPLPQLVIWKPRPANVKSIVAPLPEMSHASDATPSMLVPNEEAPLGAISLAATSLPAKSEQAAPSSTIPISIHEPIETQKPPITVAQISDKPTPVAILSLSDLHMAKGRIVLPPLNERAGAQSQNGLPTNQSATSPQTGMEATGRTNAARKEPGSSEERVTQKRLTDIRSQAHDAAFLDESHSALGTERNYPSTLITLSPNGQFAAVVVGTSPDDRFPEIERRWSGRLIYTVYLHVGLAHSWILQYCLPRSAEAVNGGRVIHLDAPWPYSMVRPDLNSGSIDADALIFNGMITQDGTFEGLSLISPPSFPEYDLVVHCLQRWKFRPAALDGHNTAVEVMLIIPTTFAE